jgi:hypothetical protein
MPATTGKQTAAGTSVIARAPALAVMKRQKEKKTRNVRVNPGMPTPAGIVEERRHRCQRQQEHHFKYEQSVKAEMPAKVGTSAKHDFRGDS